ncbi:MAG: HD domain-containing protein [Clostridia bacterium]|nr:HD domain-containing protein [Clostridia bacterium]
MHRGLDQTVLNDLLAFVHDCFSKDSSGHDEQHTLRVWRAAETLAGEEDANLAVIQLAALLHDVDDRKLSPETTAGLDRAVGFMRSHGIDEETIAAVCTAIRQVSFKGTDSVRPDTPEGCIVQDADRLDAIGAIGIARAFAYGGHAGRAIYVPDEKPGEDLSAEAYYAQKSCSINHFYEKLLLLKDMMNTDAGKKMAEGRHKFMEQYLAQFYDEWDGKK